MWQERLWFRSDYAPAANDNIQSPNVRIAWKNQQSNMADSHAGQIKT
jgi:hypothetical protein